MSAVALNFDTLADAEMAVAQALYEHWVRSERARHVTWNLPGWVEPPAWADMNWTERTHWLVEAGLVVDCLLEFVKNNPGAYGESHEPS